MFKLPFKQYAYAVGIVVLCVLLIPLEYGTFRFETIVYPTLWIALGILLIRLLRNKKNEGFIVKLRLAFAIYLFFTCIFLLRSAICATESYNTSYVHKENKSLTIVCRSFECYMTSGPCDRYKSRKLIGNWKWVTKMPEQAVDTSEWERVKK